MGGQACGILGSCGLLLIAESLETVRRQVCINSQGMQSYVCAVASSVMHESCNLFVQESASNAGLESVQARNRPCVSLSATGTRRLRDILARRLEGGVYLIEQGQDRTHDFIHSSHMVAVKATDWKVAVLLPAR